MDQLKIREQIKQLDAYAKSASADLPANAYRKHPMALTARSMEKLLAEHTHYKTALGFASDLITKALNTY